MRPATFRRGNAGLILVVLIALAIILYLMFGTGYMGTVATTRKQGKQLVQDINTQQMSMLIAMYRRDNNGKLPTSPADMEDNASYFKDPWGGPLTFTFEESKGRNGPTKVIYHSNGPDGEAKTEDDVNKTDTLPPL
jgi:hypothetical protein